MCLGGNNANHSIHYLNAQLAALWENNHECVEHHAEGLKPQDRVRYDFALCEWYYSGKGRGRSSSKEDQLFAASFDKPRIEFICNHKAIIYLKLREGHFNLDYAKATTPAFFPTRQRNVPFDGLEVAFRLDFSVHSIRGHAAKIGNGAHIIQLLVLDFANAELVSQIPIDGGKDALSFYLKKYLDYLHHAGHHVLYSLPDFDDDGVQVHIDYSTIQKDVELSWGTAQIGDVALEKVNEQLTSAWLKAAMLAEGHDEESQTADHHAICLAEYRSIWHQLGDLTDVQFHIKFGAPYVKALCDRELILYFKIDEISFYDGDDFTVAPKATYEDWQIAVVVDAIHEKNEQGGLSKIKLDMSTARWAEYLSTFAGFDASSDFAKSCKNALVEFTELSYTAVLESAQAHVLYDAEIRLPSAITEESAEESGAEEQEQEEIWDEQTGTITTVARKTTAVAAWENRVTKTETGGFDYIQAVSAASLTENYKSLVSQARTSVHEYLKILYKWSYEDSFQSSFGPLSVRLLSENKAIVWINLEEGDLKTLKDKKPNPDAPKYHFQDWRIAFEVDLKMGEQSEIGLGDAWFERFKESFAWKKAGKRDDTTLKHLYLDYRNAQFVYDLSSFEGLFQAGTRSSIALVQAAVYYVRQYYLPLLAENGHNILLTLPVYKEGSKPPAHALTDANFQMYSKDIITRSNCNRVSKAAEAAIVITGMSDFHPMPATKLAYSTDWVLKQAKGVSHGTVCLSKKVFLEERLLAVLSRVNAMTTVIPFFPEDGEWQLQLTTWAQHKSRSARACKWRLISESGAGLQYAWEHRDAWIYEHESSWSKASNGMYSVACRTKNDLFVPTQFKKGSLDVCLKGEVTLELGFKTTQKEWSTKVIAKWGANLVMASEASGLSIEVVGETAPTFEVTHTNENAIDPQFGDLKNLLQAQLPGAVDFSDLLADLRASFGGVWENCFYGMQAYSLSNPVFNRNGDIIFEVKPYVPPASVQTPAIRQKAKLRQQVSTTSIQTTSSRSSGAVSSPVQIQGSYASGGGAVQGSYSTGGAVQGTYRPEPKKHRSLLKKAKDFVKDTLDIEKPPRSRSSSPNPYSASSTSLVSAASASSSSLASTPTGTPRARTPVAAEETTVGNGHANGNGSASIADESDTATIAAFSPKRAEYDFSSFQAHAVAPVVANPVGQDL